MADRPLEEPSYLPPTPAVDERPARRAPRRLLALLALAGFFVAGIALVVVGLSHGRGTETAPPVAKTQPPPPPAPATTAERAPPAPSQPISIAAVGAFDPAGDGHENDSSASLATDGDPVTFWRTERYTTWYKPGVGLVLDAGRPVRPTALTLQTDTPGFVAEIQAGSSPTGPFSRISDSATVSETTAFRLHAPSAERYILVWITTIQAGGAADVNEVHIR